jgi:hypothetical protein
MTITDKRWARVLAMTAIAAAGFMLAGCSLLNQATNTTERDDDGTVVESNEGADVFTIKVGDCFNYGASGDTVSEVDIVPCDDAHDYEAYESVIMDGDTYPGETATQDQADADCLAPFESYVGISYDSSTLNYTSFYPTQDTWDQLNDREILCLVTDPNGQTTGSVKGAAK